MLVAQQPGLAQQAFVYNGNFLRLDQADVGLKLGEVGRIKVCCVNKFDGHVGLRLTVGGFRHQ